MNIGLVQVYTGDGKGKTTTSLGTALRAVGYNMSVYMIQFLKSGDTGELFSIRKYLPNMKIIQFGMEALKEKQMKIYEHVKEKVNDKEPSEDEIYRFLPDEQEREACRRGLEHAKTIISSGRYDIVIMDEINCVLQKKLIDINEVLELIKNKPEKTELILTGRGAPKELIDVADLVTEMKRVRHPFDKGILARKGIEY
ncbi:MAG TPA: cob(I)yrinic acid a,c-diamide adenosyltransferase [Candidatus Nanoarchaeia archaeon]|nr:cob(I)yrinic acid a,c-diamide adenosyltransferase [Candidatus Nanoarchaeia archaeon]